MFAFAFSCFLFSKSIEIAVGLLHYLLRFFLMSFSPRIYYLLYAVVKVLWWAQVDSNHRPRAYQARALTN